MDKIPTTRKVDLYWKQGSNTEIILVPSDEGKYWINTDEKGGEIILSLTAHAFDLQPKPTELKFKNCKYQDNRQNQ